MIRLIGLSVFAYIITIIDFRKLSFIINDLKWGYLFIAAGFMFLQILIKSQRWRSINKMMNIKIPFFNTIKISTTAGLLGSVTPGRLGELTKVKFIKNYSTNNMSIWIGVILDRLFDLILLIVIGIISLFLLTQLVSFKLKLYVTSAIMVFSLSIFIIFFRYFENVILLMLKKIISVETLYTIKSRYHEFLNKFQIIFKKFFLQGLIYTGISFITQCLISLFIVYSMGMQVPIHFIIILISLSALVSLLPISLGGFGTREGIYILLLSKQGFSTEAALAFAFIDGAIIGILFLGILAFTFWASNRFSLEF